MTHKNESPEVARAREENRRKYPELAKFVDEVRKYFPDAKVIKITPRSQPQAASQSQATHGSGAKAD